MSALKGKTIVVGVTGGIAAYKAAELVRLLINREAQVKVMMTRNAAEFITPLTMQTLSTNQVATETFSLTQESEIGHIRLADTADAIAIVPATANVIAKAAAGIADDIVTTVLLAAHCPVGFAPAMNVHMYDHPSVTENLAKLRSRGVTVIEPGVGDLACGYTGKGRMAEPVAIVDEIERMVSPHDLSEEHVLITAGPTQEAIDPVRFVSNHSSGKMGFALARAAWRRGAQVRVIAGPTALTLPDSIERIDTISAQDLLRETSRNFPWCSALIMSAAIADFRPANPAPHKVKKQEAGLTLEMAAIADEMPRLAADKGSRLLIGFAAETENLQDNAADKLRRKKLDLIVANDVTQEGAGFSVDTNIVTLIGADGHAESHPMLTKDEVADIILDRVVAIRAGKPRSTNLHVVH